MKQLIFLSLWFMMTATWAKDAPVVELQTNMGKIVLELNPQQAPKTVENFLEYAKSGFYEGTIFHRVISDFMIQGGGYTKDLTKKPTHPAIPNEANNGLKNRKGTVAMARTGDPNSATSQFFINMADNHFLDHQAPTPSGWGYTVFGQVIQGMDVLNEIQAIKTGAQGPFPKEVPEKAVIIQKVTITQAKPSDATDSAKKAPPEVEKAPPVVKEKTEEPVSAPETVPVKEAPKVVEKTATKEANEAQSAVPAKDPPPPVASESKSALSVPKGETEVIKPVEMAKPAGEKLPKESMPEHQEKPTVLAPDSPSKPDKPEPPPS